jgi:hypothetical protein
MRARHRHFQFRHAGAIFSLDARFVHGVSDASNLETWSDRSGNNYNATRTVSDIPTYRSSEINGTPAIRFASQYYDVTVPIPSNSTTVAALRRSTSSSVSTPLASKTDAWPYSYWWFSDNVIYSRHNSNAGVTHASNETSTGNFVFGGIWSGSTTTVWRNGVSVGGDKTSASAAGSGNFTAIGRWNNGFNANCSWGAYHLLNTAASQSVHKRLQHHVAFAFKIACN